MNKKTEPFLSILIPTWNRFEFVMKAIKSVGTISDKTEIIVVENDPDKEKFALLKDNFTNSPGVKLFQNNQNIGMVKNWNKCISYANGKWMGMLNDDDNYIEGAINRAHKLLEIVDSPSLIVQDPNIEKSLEKLPKGSAAKLNLPHVSGNFWHRKIIETIGGFDERFKYSADVEFWYRAAHFFPVIKVKEPFAKHNYHGTNYMWTTWRQEDFLEQIKLLGNTILKYTLENGKYTEEIVDKKIKEGLWDTICTIIQTTYLNKDKQDIFKKYIKIAYNEADTFQKKRALMVFLLKVASRDFKCRLKCFGDKLIAKYV